MSPLGPWAPTAPSLPGVPGSPLGPAGPRSPLGPALPAGPTGPSWPRSPGAPSCPLGPGTPFSPRKSLHVKHRSQDLQLSLFSIFLHVPSVFPDIFLFFLDIDKVLRYHKLMFQILYVSLLYF